MLSVWMQEPALRKDGCTDKQTKNACDYYFIIGRYALKKKLLWKCLKLCSRHCAMYQAHLLRGKRLLGKIWPDGWKLLEENICLLRQNQDRPEISQPARCPSTTFVSANTHPHATDVVTLVVEIGRASCRERV